MLLDLRCCLELPYIERISTMTGQEKIEEIKQRARKNFSLGYNCAECVTEAVLSLIDTGLPSEV